MPNWCTTNVAIYGDNPVLVRKFYDDVIKAMSDNPDFTPISNSWGTNWIGNLFLEKGYSEEFLNTHSGCRGSIDSVELLDMDQGVILYETVAWTPNNEILELLLEEHYKGLRLVYVADEPGMEIFINTDEDHRFFSEQYRVEHCDEEGNWDLILCSDIGELFDTLSKVLDVSKEEAKEIYANNTMDQKYKDKYGEGSYLVVDEYHT